MPVTVKKRAKKAPKKARKIFAEKERMPNLENDPYFVKKAEAVKEMLRQDGIILEP